MSKYPIYSLVLFISSVTLILTPSASFSQGSGFGGGTKFHGGLTLQQISVKGNVSKQFSMIDPNFYTLSDTTVSGNIHESRILLGLSFNFNSSIYHFNDDISIGNTTELKIGGWGKSGNFYFFSNVPTYLTFRYGASATNESKRRFGVGFGAGLQFAFNYLTGSNFYYKEFFPNYSAVYAHPAIMFDIHYATENGGCWGIRFNKLAGPFIDHRGQADVNNEFWRNMGFTITKSFN